MRLSFSVLQALRGGVVTGGVACALTVGCGGATHAESTTPEPVHAQSQTSTRVQPAATVSNQNVTTTLAVTPTVTPETTETQTTSDSPENTPSPVEPEDYSAMAACGRG